MKRGYVVTVAVLSLFSTLALAGYLQPAPVIVTQNADGSGSSTGDMVTARFSSNTVEFIGCGIRVFDDGVGGNVQWGFCQAADSADVKGFCSTTRPDLLETMHATADYSFITFAWDVNGECTRVGFSTQSFYIPEHLDKAKGK